MKDRDASHDFDSAVHWLLDIKRTLIYLLGTDAIEHTS